MNGTIEKFGWPATLVREFEHWVVLARPAQPTLGSLVLAAKSDVTAFGDLPPGAHAELAKAAGEIEASLASFVHYGKLNYLMLMMVDPHVHFHVIPRYRGSRIFCDLEFADLGWPQQPALDKAQKLDEDLCHRLVTALKAGWLPACPAL